MGRDPSTRELIRARYAQDDRSVSCAAVKLYQRQATSYPNSILRMPVFNKLEPTPFLTFIAAAVERTLHCLLEYSED